MFFALFVLFFISVKALTPFQNSISIYKNTLKYLRMADSPQASVDLLKTQWAREILSKLNLNIETVGEVTTQKSIFFVGNHISYLDIPLLMAQIENLSFVAKKELERWPIFGRAAKKADTVFVSRNNHNSRKSVRDDLKDAIHSGRRIAIFPSGTTSANESTYWKKGVFEIAQELDIYIQPFRIVYEPLEQVSYVGRDFFPIHLYSLCGLESIEAKIEFHEPTKVTDPISACLFWQNWAKPIRRKNYLRQTEPTLVF